MTVLYSALAVLALLVEYKLIRAAIRTWIWEWNEQTGQCWRCHESATHLIGKGMRRTPLCQEHTRAELRSNEMYEFAIRSGHAAVIDEKDRK